ncbi:MAG: hypothetical protein WCJ30_16760, partial [Deltaproteobacteria bacterium]
ARVWLQAIHAGSHGNADLCAYFFRGCARLLGRHGTLGFIATDAIAQGDTRVTGLKWLVDAGWMIYEASTQFHWPGAADVVAAVVHVAAGTPASIDLVKVLDGDRVATIDSRLRVGTERDDAVSLSANADLSFVGSYLLGQGFVLTPQQRDALLARQASNAARLFPFLGGEELNSQPRETLDRYVINFDQLPLEEAEQWPDLLKIVRDTVKPERELNHRENYRTKWWLYGEYRTGLYSALRSYGRCLVNSQVSRHLVFAWRPVGYVFGHTLYVHVVESSTYFAIVQSRLHEQWARLLSSSYGGTGTVLRYRAAEVIGTFAFPRPDPRAVIPSLESVGERVYASRAAYMVDNSVGLTTTYNRLKDPACADPRILEMRTLHEEMDRAVLDAYGWSDIAVPPFCIATEADKKALEAFENEVIDRLFALNAKRAEEEKLRGLGGPAGKGSKRHSTAAAQAIEPAATSTTKPKPRKPKGSSGPALPGVE